MGDTDAGKVVGEKKVAVITGGASGIGLAVATHLSTHGPWTIHILDLSPPPAPSPFTFHACDVTSSTALSTTFATIFARTSRIDFVFANAGAAERSDFYADHSAALLAGQPPALPIKDLSLMLSLNLQAVIETAYLALQYQRLSPGHDKSLVLTSSCGAFYPSYWCPAYTATKHGVLGFMRAVAPAYAKSGIRVNAICPSTVRTNLLSEAEWGNFPGLDFTAGEKVAQVVMALINGKDDGTGLLGEEVRTGREDYLRVLAGKAVEISGGRHYYREQLEFCDEAMRTVMGYTEIEEFKGDEGR